MDKLFDAQCLHPYFKYLTSVTKDERGPKGILSEFYLVIPQWPRTTGSRPEVNQLSCKEKWMGREYTCRWGQITNHQI